MWLILCIIATILSGFLDIFEKKGSKDQPLRFLFWGLLIYNLFNLILGIIFSDALNTFNIINCLKILPYNIVITIGYYCSIKSLSKGNISTVSPIMRSEILLILLLSSIFLQEKLTILQVILIFIILLLNIILTNEDNNKKHNLKSVLYAFGFLIFNGTATFLNKLYVIHFTNPFEISFYTAIVQLFLLLVIIIVARKFDYFDIRKFKGFKYALLMESTETITILLNRYSLIDGKLAIVTTITSCNIIITLLLSKILFKEEIGFQKWIIILLIIFSITVLSVLSL